jgi:PAS domain S-box-containing protein
MEQKPTYKECKQRIKEVEEEVVKLKLGKNELKGLKECLKILFEFAQDGYFLCDIKGRFVDCNKTAERLLGYKRKELIGKNFLKFKLLSPIEIKKADMLFAKNATGHPTGPDEFSLNRKDGSQVELEIRAFPVKIEDKTMILAIARDNTERKRNAKVLQKIEKRYRTLFESSRDAIISVNQKGKILQGNPAALKMFGCVDNAEFASLHIIDLSPEYQPDETLSLVNVEQVRKIAQEKDSQFFEWKFKRKDGTEFFATVLINKLELDNEIVLQDMVRDITENKLTAEALKKREQELEMKTESLGKANTALEVLLKKREEDGKRLEERVLFNMRQVVEPYLEKLKNSILDERQKVYLSILEKNLNEIISAFPQALSSLYIKLTPTEREVASLVKQGKTTKEIASALGIAQRTAEVHRENIRKKFNLNNKKDNLRTYLTSL